MGEGAGRARGSGGGGGRRRGGRGAAAACPAPRGGRAPRRHRSAVRPTAPRAGEGCASCPQSAGPPSPDPPAPAIFRSSPSILPPQGGVLWWLFFVCVCFCFVCVVCLFVFKPGATLDSGKGLLLWLVVQFRSIPTSARISRLLVATPCHLAFYLLSNEGDVDVFFCPSEHEFCIYFYTRRVPRATCPCLPPAPFAL